MNKIDTALAHEAKRLLKTGQRMGTVAKVDRDLDWGNGEKAMTIVTYADGSATRHWGHINGRQVATAARKARKATTKIERVVVDGFGRGDMLRTTACYTLAGIELVAA